MRNEDSAQAPVTDQKSLRITHYELRICKTAERLILSRSAALRLYFFNIKPCRSCHAVHHGQADAVVGDGFGVKAGDAFVVRLAQ